MSAKESVLSTLKWFDDYPQKISLKYNKAGSYPSVAGGCISLVVWLIILWWSANTIADYNAKDFD
jgi:hypothetical protein